MSNLNPAVLVLGGTGRTGSLVATKLRERGRTARTAARQGADVRFDWDDPSTQRSALRDADRVYLVAPVPRVRYADQVAAFLDLAEAAGVRHVTYLSTYRGDQAPPEMDFRPVELDLMSRRAFTQTILRPGWLMQNFADQHVPIVDDLITVPTGGGAEAFVDAADIAAVAAETLAHPEAHAGAQYAPAGPEALTVAQVAQIIGEVTGRPIRHHDIDRPAWIAGALATGFLPADYGVILDWQTTMVASGHGSRPTGDIRDVTGTPPTRFADFARRSWPARVAR